MASFPPVRPEYQQELVPLEDVQLEHPLSLTQRLWNFTPLRKTLLIIVLALLWEAGARWQNNDLMLPGVIQIACAFIDDMYSEELPAKIAISQVTLVKGYLVGSLLALVLSALTISTRWGQDLLSTLTAMLNPLPAIALLLFALLWFGLGANSLIFVLIHSVLWPMALNTWSGFLGVSDTLHMTGRNYGLSGLRYVWYILVPAALSSILAGLKIGWAFSWRTLIAAELVFGASSGQGVWGGISSRIAMNFIPIGCLPGWHP